MIYLGGPWWEQGSQILEDTNGVKTSRESPYSANNNLIAVAMAGAGQTDVDTVQDTVVDNSNYQAGLRKWLQNARKSLRNNRDTVSK
jgi:hypothetical protein